MIDILKYILTSPLTYIATCMCALLVIGLEAIWREVFRDLFHEMWVEIKATVPACAGSSDPKG